MAYQWIFDHAETLSINKRGITAQSITRDQRIRSVSRGGEIWRFTVSMPTGLTYNANRGYIEALDQADRTAVETVNLSKYSYIGGYRGNATSPNSMLMRQTAAIASDNTKQIELSNLPAIGSSQYLFRAGDIIQIGGRSAPYVPDPGSDEAVDKYVYTVVTDVVRGSDSTATATLNRSVLTTPANYYRTLITGTGVNWTVICTQRPDWRLVSKDIIEWTGDFVFQEVL